MQIDIKQKKLTMGSKYDISIDSLPSHTASSPPFQVYSEISLYAIGNGRPRMTINQQWAWLKAKYAIARWDNNIQVAWWDKEAVSFFAGDIYQIIARIGIVRRN